MFAQKVAEQYPVSSRSVSDIHEVLKLEDAFSVETSSELRESYFRMLGAIIVAAGLFYTGYQVSKLHQPANKIAEALTSLNEKAGVVLDSVKHIEQLAESLVQQISHLIQELAGKIDEAFLKQAMAEARARVYNLLDYYSSEERYLNGLDSIKKIQEQLTESIEKMRVFSGNSSTAFILQAAPFLANWIQAYEAVEYGRFVLSQRAEGASYVQKKFTESPYFQSIFSQCEEHFRNLDRLYQIALAFKQSTDFLKENATYGYDFVNDHFQEASGQVIVPKGPNDQKVFRFHIEWEKSDNKKTNAILFCARHFGTHMPPYSSISYVKVEATSMHAIERDALNRFQSSHKIQMQNAEAVTSYNGEAQSVKLKILDPGQAITSENISTPQIKM